MTYKVVGIDETSHFPPRVEQRLATEAAARSTEDRQRANHLGTQTASTIIDLREAVEDYVAALMQAGTAVTLAYVDNGTGAGSLTITGTGGGAADPEATRDLMGIALVGSGLVSVVVNDAADTITISTTATANSTDAFLLARANHTGSQTLATISDYIADQRKNCADLWYDTVNNVWPLRNTVTTDVLRRVCWIGTATSGLPPTTAGYAISSRDKYELYG